MPVTGFVVLINELHFDGKTATEVTGFSLKLDNWGNNILSATLPVKWKNFG